MKIWNAYGSEHSMNLVMIGHFRDAATADETKTALEELQQFFLDHEPDGRTYEDEAMEILRRHKFNIAAPGDLEQFRYDFRITTEREKLIIKTEESEFSALLKLMIERGAKIEVYSAHDYPNEKYGRGK